METTSGGVDQGSFPDPQDSVEVHNRKTLIKQAEFWLKMHDVYERAAKVFVDIKHWMAHWSDENPPPDPERGPPQDREFQTFADGIAAVAAREALRYAKIEINSQHNEGGPTPRGGGEQTWKDKIAFPLIVAAIVGAVVTYAKVASIETTMTAYHEEDLRRDQERRAEYERRMSRIESKLFP